jgi:hypothetical protein
MTCCLCVRCTPVPVVQLHDAHVEKNSLESVKNNAHVFLLTACDQSARLRYLLAQPKLAVDSDDEVAHPVVVAMAAGSDAGSDAGGAAAVRDQDAQGNAQGSMVGGGGAALEGVPPAARCVGRARRIKN